MILRNLLSSCSLYICVVIFTSPSFSLEAKDYNGTLELVHLMWRHGDRAPITLYPTDPYNDPGLWPDGYGQLTKIGKEMQYELGRWLRKRYDGFVSTKWIPEEVYVQSTNVDRTMMSASCNLAAFYYPEEPSRFKKDLAWMPTPIHATPASEDRLLSVDETCPRIKKEIENTENLPFFVDVIEKAKDLCKYLSEKCGKNITSLLDVDYLYDTLHIEKIYNKTLPDWADENYDRMHEISDLSFVAYAYTLEMKRLRAGPMIKAINDHMKLKVEGNDSMVKRRMFMYSAHDTTVATLLSGLNVFNNVAPPYASTVLIELHKINEEHFVKVFLRNDTKIQDPPYPLQLPGCAVKCPLNDWLRITSEVISDDWSEECKLEESYDFSVNAATISVLFVALIFAFMFSGLCIYNIIQWKQQRNFSYQAIPNVS